MFKKILFSALIGIFLCAGIGYAQTDPATEDTTATEEVKVLDLTEPIDILPVLKQGVLFSVDDQNFTYVSTAQILEWKGLSLEGGYALPDELVMVGSYRLGGLENFGINVPVLDLIDCNVGYYIGWKDLNDSQERKFDHGLAVTLLNIKF